MTKGPVTGLWEVAHPPQHQAGADPLLRTFGDIPDPATVSIQ